MSWTWRSLTLDDAEAVAKLLIAAEAVEPTGEHYSADDIREELAAPNVRLPDGSTSAWDGDRLIAYALVSTRDAANPVHKMRVESMAHPGHRDERLGARLIDWYVRTGGTVHEQGFQGAPLELYAQAHENQHWYREVLEAGGFRHMRLFVDMRVDLSALPPARDLPADLRLVRFEDGFDEPTRLAVNDAFAGHWGSVEYSPELWRHRITGSPSFRPELSFLLLPPSGNEVSAFVLSAYFESDTEATGVRELLVSYVGTSAALRRRGIATALLGHTLAAARDRGYQRATLCVDTDNASNALGIYRRCGFDVVGSWYSYVRDPGA